MKKDREFWESAKMNNVTFRHYFSRLTEMAISIFEWKNVPDTIDIRFLELALFSDGKAVFFKDEELGYLALRCALGGEFNVYRIPTNRRAYANNGYNRNLNEKDSIIIWNNYLHTNSVPNIEMYAKRLWNLDRIIDINSNAQKTPVLIVCDENQRLTMKNAYMKYEGNEPVIWGDNKLNKEGISVLKTDAPYISDKIYTLRTQIWNEALTYLGISNTNITKKERLLVDEVNRNQGGIIASRYSKLNARKEACEQINKMFGLNLDVDFRDDFAFTVDEQEKNIEGDINE